MSDFLSDEKFKLIQEQAKQAKFLKICETKEELGDWYLMFLGIDLPDSSVDPDSTSSPLQAAWNIYSSVKDNKGDEVPGYILLASRDSFKTIVASMVNFILLLHFRSTITHMAAIERQAQKGASYITSYLNKVEPYLTKAGWTRTSDNKNKIEFKTPDGDQPYLAILTCTKKSANSEHTNLMSIDELDLADPVAYEESKMIPSMYKGKYPITIKLSTRKYAFGLMQKELDDVKNTGESIERWNIIDVAEKCPKTRHQPNEDGSKVECYTSKKLPLTTIGKDQYDMLAEVEKEKWSLTMAHPGCLKCPLLPVCQTRLADNKPDSAKGGLYKPIAAVITNFKALSDDMAEAQLLCWRPSASGLVYPRFEEKSNIIDVATAYKTLSGNEPWEGISLDQLVDYVHQTGIRFYVGGDWGHSGGQAFVVCAMIPNGEWWIFDTYCVPDLEFDDVLKLGMQIRDRYQPRLWFMDTNMPAFIKTFNKNGMTCKDFKKDVMAGIEAVRTQISDSSGKRRMKVIRTDRNEQFIDAIRKHHFKLDSAGEPTDTPSDGDEAHIADSVRYIGQNLFETKGGKPLISTPSSGHVTPTKDHSEELHNVVKQSISEPNKSEVKKDKNGKIFWSF